MPVSYTHLIANMQQVIDSGSIGAKKKEVWLSLGITLCVILANEVDGLEWLTNKLETMSNGLKIIADNQFAFASFRIGVSYTFGGDIRLSLIHI